MNDEFMTTIEEHDEAYAAAVKAAREFYSDMPVCELIAWQEGLRNRARHGPMSHATAADLEVLQELIDLTNP